MASNDKVAIVTGAGTGIGKAASTALLKAGQGGSCWTPQGTSGQSRRGGGAGGRALAPHRRVRPAVGARCSPRQRRLSGVSTCCSTTRASAPGVPLEELTDQWKAVVDINLTGFSCAPRRPSSS
jgi:NAD(P)-dependent dehydrogenase (short-subunit alcohol dehydrogenase family)